MAPTLRFLSFTVQSYMLAVLVGVWAGLWMAARVAQRLGVDGDRVYSLGFRALVVTVLCARLVYVINHWAAYQDALLSALSPTPVALAWSEGALIGAVVAVVFWNRFQLPVGATLDAVAPGLALAMALERLGAFLDGSGVGEPTTLPWGVPLWGIVRHPVQVYETAALLAILGVLWWRRERRSFDGNLFVLFVGMYAGLRLFLEGFRAQTPLMANGARTVQVVALVVVLGAVWYMYGRRFPEREPIPDVALGDET